MTDKLQTDAHQVDAPTLLESAARLIERALIQLDMRHEMCAACTSLHYKNVDHKRIYERFTDLPYKLNDAALTLRDPAAAAKLRKINHDAERGIKRVRNQSARDVRSNSSR